MEQEIKTADSILNKYTTKLTDGTEIRTKGNTIRAMEEYKNQFVSTLPEQKERFTHVNDGLPKDGQDVLIRTNNQMKIVASTYSERNKSFERYKNAINGDRCTVYHYTDVIDWMPFPTEETIVTTHTAAYWQKVFEDNADIRPLNIENGMCLSKNKFIETMLKVS